MNRDAWRAASEQIKCIDNLREKAITARAFCRLFKSFNPYFNAPKFCRGAGVELTAYDNNPAAFYLSALDFKEDRTIL